MKYAIVDIGSNAIKYKIFNETLELVEYYRHPLRLGRDVFSKGYLEEKTIQELLNLLLNYLEIFEKHKIKNVSFIATSALRDTENSQEIIKLLKENNINLKIISGDIEASLLSEFNKTKKNSAVIDIGGGSLEICVNSNNVIHAKSFQLGAVRLLNLNVKDKAVAIEELSVWLRQFKLIKQLYGLGGNLRALMQANSISGPIKTSEFNKLITNYKSIDNSILIQDYKIPEDRIDIIPEALNLYSLIIKELDADIIENSFWSISDGMVRKILKDQL
tara:strand:- start:8193 stop:9017 length:825 start_codon:yes stop_codon:yes gene_type:complete